MHILFWRVKYMTNKQGLAPIYCRITVNKKRSEFSTGLFIEASKWCPTSQKVKGTSTETKLHNTRLTEIKAKLDMYYLDLIKNNRTVTSELLKNLYSGKQKFNYSLIELFNEFIDKQKQLVGTSLSKASIEAYTVRRNNLQSFLGHIKRPALMPDEFTLKYGHNYVAYLTGNKKLSVNYVRKNVETITQMFKWAERQELITRSPLSGFVVKREEDKEIIYLEVEEIEYLKFYKLASIGMQRARDLFIFSCYTGLSYQDAQNFDRRLIYKGVDDREWITGNRQKSGTRYALPLLSGAKLILEKYEYELPKMSNQTYNTHLTQISSITGLGKKLTTHAGRKTFVNLCLNVYNIPPETVAAMIGHKGITLLMRRYGKISQKRISLDMKDIE